MRTKLGMIKFKLKSVIEAHEFKWNRKISVMELVEETGIGRSTLSKMLNQKGANTSLDKLDKLCKFFDCKIEDLVEYIPDQEV
jgi:putative transcriptional regulator